METIAVVVGVVVAIGGWFANGVLERRSVRRRMRIDYLLAAYRDLDEASNRTMTVDHESAIERAIAQIQLLGTRQQVQLADDFVQLFASEGTADTGPLLEDLRSTLRRELLLEALPARKTWLRITRDGQWAQESARIRAQVPVEARGPTPEAEVVSTRLVELAESDATTAVVEAYAAVEADLLNRLATPTGTALRLGGGDLTRAALAQGAISSETAAAIDGLTVMRNLAVHGGREVTSAQAREFLLLVDAVLFALSREPRASD